MYLYQMNEELQYTDTISTRITKAMDYIQSVINLLTYKTK